MRHWYWRAAIAVLTGTAASCGFNMGVSVLLPWGPGISVTLGIPIVLSSYLVAGIVSVATWHFFTLWCIRRRRARLIRAGLCRSCGYDLTGNTSGVCPECGTPVNR